MQVRAYHFQIVFSRPPKKKIAKKMEITIAFLRSMHNGRSISVYDVRKPPFSAAHS